VSGFVDEARVKVAGGDGGHGLIAFRREKYVPRGGPCGGDGGKGGDVLLVVDPHLHTLLDFRYRHTFRGKRGAHGGGNSRTGRSGEDTEIRVPPGTEIHDADTGTLIADLTRAGERFVIARGGRGGRGNQRFATATNQSPQTAEDGHPGEERVVVLTLKLLADVGLVGFPNAGKSTLLAALSAARPKIADYPFTTLEPHLGIVSAGEYASFVLADIPGLIEGASEGKGLGHQFLRHVERTRVLLFLVECLDPEPDRTVETLRRELGGHSRSLLDKPYRIALTKTDLLSPEEDPPGISRVSPGAFMISSHSQSEREGASAVMARLPLPTGDMFPMDLSTSPPDKILEAIRRGDLRDKKVLIEALGRQRSERAVEVLGEILEGESWYLRDLAVKSMVAIGEPSVPRLLYLLGSGLWYTRAAAARALGKMGHAQSLPYLVHLLADPNQTVQGACLASVADLVRGGEAQETARLFWNQGARRAEGLSRLLLAVHPEAGRAVAELLADPASFLEKRPAEREEEPEAEEVGRLNA
jgi:GTP-binding protein